jgi:hypothetical protein
VAEEAGVNPQSFEAAVEEIPDPGLESGISAVNPVDPQTAVIAPEDFDAPDPQMRESDRDALSITEPKILDVPLTGVLVQEAPPKTRVRGTARTRAKSRKSLHGRAHVVAADEFPRGGLPATVATPGLEETPTPQAELFEPDAGLLPDLEAHSEPDAPIEVPESVKPSEPELFDADFIPQPAVEFVEAPVDGARLEQAWRDDSPYIRETWDGHLAPVSLPKIRPVFAAAAPVESCNWHFPRPLLVCWQHSDFSGIAQPYARTWQSKSWSAPPMSPATWFSISRKNPEDWVAPQTRPVRIFLIGRSNFKVPWSPQEASTLPTERKKPML